MAWDNYLELIALGIDLSITALLYKLYKDRCKREIEIKNAPHYVLGSELYKAVRSQMSLPYASVEGSVELMDPADVVKSRFGEDRGTIRHTLLTEHKSKRQSGYWVDVKNIIKDYTDKVPFKLQNPTLPECSLCVEQPLEADYINDELKVTYDKFESTESGLLKRGLDRMFGEVTKGYQERERMLTIGTHLLGVGRIAMDDGKYVIEPPLDGQRYILTRMSKKELLMDITRGTRVLKVVCWVLGSIGVGLAISLCYHKYTRYRAHRREQQVFDDIREGIRTRNDAQGEAANNDDGTNENGDNKCVICLDAERSVVLMYCGHICVCVDCANALPRPRKCPVCRGQVDRIVPTYMS